MKTGLIKTFSILALATAAAGVASAAEPETTLAWQQPGYVQEVVIATAPRPSTVSTAATDIELAWQQPGYVQEVVIVRASRAEVLAEARARAARRLSLALLDNGAGAF